ncbi:hydroxyproline-rich glycoprotein family protein [Striga hermonthica]|uniref:Hydroxyproline-rich glycoprotein family protein n=1 Tax=Striga hermonthica TaxID=68872 RepID=A0A9N7RPI3_STRHE|nr:hydroxyproline-rich glycoprotein family protein [Striga hermonthica]
MAGKQFSGDRVPPSLAGMSKNQLYDIMSQMKTLIEQNKQQARQILIQNPVLTRALFQAQIMLGMVQPPQASPAISSTASQIFSPHPPPVSNQKPKIQPTSSFPGQAVPNQIRKQQINQTPSQNPNQTMASRNLHPQPTPLNPHPQSAPSRPLQSKAHLGAQSAQMSMPMPAQSSQVPNITQLPPQLPNISQLPQHSVSQPTSLHHPSVPSLPPQSQQPIQSSGNQYLPPVPLQPRGPMPGFPHQGPSGMGPNMGFQHPGGPPIHHSQHMYHSGGKPHGSMGPSFPQGQLPHSNQPMPPSIYQTGYPHLGMDYNQSGNSRQTDRGGPNWTSGVQENPMGQLQRPLSFPGQVGPSNQPPRPDQQLTPELEKTLLQQLMSLTPEQINSMPPEHRNQILQLQQMLHQ